MKKNIILTVALKALVIILFIVSLIFVEDMFVSKAKADDNIEKAYGQTQFLKIVYEKMLLREEHITIKYVGEDFNELFESFEDESFLDKVSAIDDPTTSDDFDYLGSNLSYMKTGMRHTKSTEALFTIEIKWRESYQELLYVNDRIRRLIDELGLKDMNTYQKVKKVHDYIVKNVEYDTALKDENAYKALSEASSTCQGYSLLFYKIMTEIGVDCRYVTGTGISDEGSGPHGWDIVKIGDYWYNIDVTWDDPVYINSKKDSEKSISYDFFLKGRSDSFEKTHVRDGKFLTGEFLAKYPIDDNNFDESEYDGFEKDEEKEPLTWNLSYREINGVDDRYKVVKINDVTTYFNLITNLCVGFDDCVSEKGLFGTIVDIWSNMNLPERTIIIALMIFIILNSIMKNLMKEKEENDEEEDIKIE